MERPTALITGASAGIGRAFAHVFAQNKYNVILVARSTDKLEEVAREIRQQSAVDVTVMSQDLATAAGAQQLFDRVRTAGLQVDVLVNNAGMTSLRPFHLTEPSRLEKIVQLNVMTLMKLTRLFVAPMIERGQGKILNVASIASFITTPSLAVYGATKSFVLSFSEAIGQELKGTGVTVTCLCPGFTKTDMLKQGGGIEHYIPNFMKLDAETVAHEGFEACMKGKGLHVDSLSNNMMIQWLRLQPRWLVRTAGGFLTSLFQ